MQNRNLEKAGAPDGHITTLSDVMSRGLSLYDCVSIVMPPLSSAHQK